jgi:hypothetical protein
VKWRCSGKLVGNGDLECFPKRRDAGFSAANRAKEDRKRNYKMKIAKSFLAGVILAVTGWSVIVPPASADSQDSRQMVKLPEIMQKHMLMNMRDHLVALDEILGELAEGNTDRASEIAEKRLGMSSMGLHGAAHLGKFMPKEMGQLGTQMHHAASRFVVVARNAELEPGIPSQRKVYKALQQITEKCNACHQGYRIR